MHTARLLTVSASMHCTGGCLLPGVWYPSMHWGRPPPSCEQNDRQVQKYYLAPNFVAVTMVLMLSAIFYTKRFIFKQKYDICAENRTVNWLLLKYHGHYNQWKIFLFITTRKRSLRRLCFYMCVSVHRGWGAYLGRYLPGPGTPPGPGTLPWAGTPSRDQVHPWDHLHPPRTRYTPQTRYTPRTRYIPQDQVYPQGLGTPSWDQVHPLPRTRYTPAPEQCMLGDAGNKRAVRILLECILVHIKFIQDKAD